MNEQLQIIKLVAQEYCGWDQVSFFFFSGNVFSNLIYYSHFLPAITAILFGVLVLLSDRKHLINRVLFFVMIAFATWTLFDLVLWASDSVSTIMFIWSSLIYLEPLIYIGCYYIFYLFVYGKDLPFSRKLPLALLLLPVIIFAPTEFNLQGFDFTNCEREAPEGILWNYVYLLEFIVILFITVEFIFSWKKIKAFSQRRQNTLIFIGTILFLLTFSFGNIVGSFSFDWSIAQYGLFGMPIFIAFLSYLVSRYQRFNTKILSTQLLIGSLWVLIMSLFFVQDLTLIRIIVGITLALAIGFGILLSLSVSKEVKQRKELQKLAEDLQHANTRLKELDAQKTEFISLATHQIRGPLGAIKGYASMVLEGDYGPLPDLAKKAVEVMMKSAQALVIVVGDYLDVSRIEQGRMKYDFSTFDLKELVLTVTKEVAPIVDIAKLTLSFDHDEAQTYTVNADAGKLKQVIGNIIDNAIKYTPKGSISVHLEKNAGKILLSVKDTGVGIKKEVMPLLFNKFSRAPDASKTNIMGTGLGLFVAAKMIQAHKGRVWAESEGEGKGSQFYIELDEVK